MSFIAGRMIKFAAVAGMLSAASCSTVDTVSRNKPVFVGHASRPRTEVAACIARNWQNDKRFKTKIVDHGQETLVTLDGSLPIMNDMVAIVDDGGHVALHRRPDVWQDLGDQLQKGVSDCL